MGYKFLMQEIKTILATTKTESDEIKDGGDHMINMSCVKHCCECGRFGLRAFYIHIWILRTNK
jgi:hypothetical protein